MDWDAKNQKAIGLLEDGSGGGATLVSGVIRYIAGCVKRERERIARILKSNGVDENIVKAIVNEDDDVRVFRWRGPETKLDDVVKVAEEAGS